MHNAGQGPTSRDALGSPISPLLANLYFHRFLLAWERFGHRKQLDAYVVNYADDLVICCRPGSGSAALAVMRELMTRHGLTVNEAKTRLVQLPEEAFDFLGYTIGRLYGRGGRPYMGTRPSRKAVRRLLQRIHDATTLHKHAAPTRSAFLVPPAPRSVTSGAILFRPGKVRRHRAGRTSAFGNSVENGALHQHEPFSRFGVGSRSLCCAGILVPPRSPKTERVVARPGFEPGTFRL